jgi:predicted MFS family arabinose efflux permease
LSPPSPAALRAQAWQTLAGAFAILFLVQGGRTIIGVALKPIAGEFGWDRASISMAIFLNMACFALTLTAVGRIFDRYGARRVIVAATLLVAIGFAGITRVSSLWGFYLFFGVCAAVGFGGTSIPLFAAIVSRRFTSGRGLAVSVALAGGCIGHFGVVLFATQMVVAHDWRTAFLVTGGAILAVNLVVTTVLIRDDPPPDRAPGRRTDGSIDGGGDLGLPEAARTAAFWLYLTVMFICGGGDYLVMTHLVPMATDSGVSQQAAGGMLAWYGLASLVGVLAAGRSADRFGNKWPVCLAFGIRLIAMLLVLGSPSESEFYLFAVLFGFTNLVTAPITTTLVVKLYGPCHLGLITGLITTVHHLSGGLWAFAGGAVFDRAGSYRPILLVYAGAAVIAALCAAAIRERRHAIDR